MEASPPTSAGGEGPPFSTAAGGGGFQSHEQHPCAQGRSEPADWFASSFVLLCFIIYLTCIPLVSRPFGSFFHCCQFSENLIKIKAQMGKSCNGEPE
jgi:hypothetical protein